MEDAENIFFTEIYKQKTYRTCFLNSQGIVDKIIVFKGTDKETNNAPLFQTKFRENKNVVNITSNQYLHEDDSIRIIKKKIMKELEKDTITYNELYLFSNIKQQYNKFQILSIFQNLVRLSQKETTITYNVMMQFCMNMGISAEDAKEIKETKEEYTYEDFLQLSIFENDATATVFAKIPLGQKKEGVINPLFSGNPFDVLLVNENLQNNIENLYNSYENSMLFSYGEIIDNTIFVCSAENIFDFAIHNNFNQEYFSRIYFPLLFNLHVVNKWDLLNNKQDLIEKNKGVVRDNDFKLYETIDLFYDIHKNRESDLLYLEQGVKSFKFNIHTDFKHLLPLEIIFKNIHAVKSIPFIKYNPGSRRDSLFRLYNETIATNGKPVPYLSESTITRLTREYGRSRQIVLFIQIIYKTQPYELIMTFENNGNIFVSGNFKKNVSLDVLNNIVKEAIKPVIENIDGLLQQSGYSVENITGLLDPKVEIKNMKYNYSIQFNSGGNIISLKKITGCLSSIFDIYDDNLSKGAVLRYKRVENFKEMDAQTTLIYEIYGKTDNMQVVVKTLMDNYQMTEPQALQRFALYIQQNQQSIHVENPGFPVSIKYSAFDGIMTFEIDNIISLEYVRFISIYIDSIVRILQNNTNEFVEKIDLLCKRIVPKQTDKPHIDNIITTAPELLKPQAITFSMMEMNDLDLFSDDEKEDEDEVERVKDVKSTATNSVIKAKKVVEPIIAEPVEEKEPFLFDIEEDEDEVVETENKVVENETNTQTQKSEENKGETEDDDEEDEIDDDNDVFMFDMEEEDEDEEGSKKTGSGYDIKGKGTKIKKHGGVVTESSFDNMSLNNPNLFQDRLEKRDPTLFLKRDEGNFKAYGRFCQSSARRQPVILTDEEKAKIDKEHPGSYVKESAVKYGTDPNKQYWYICPRYWCLLNSSPISQEEVDSGVCGKIIPQSATTVPKGHYIFEFKNDKEHTDKDGKYVQHHPGFSKEGAHPDGYCVPCCFKNWESKEQKNRRDKCSRGNNEIAEEPEPIEVEKAKEVGEIVQNTNKSKKETKNLTKNTAKNLTTLNEKINLYVINPTIFPIENKRWGFLPHPVEMFLQINNDDYVNKDNKSMISTDTPAILRYGVEHSQVQSFLACMSDIFASQNNIPTPTIAEFRKILVNSVTLDLFVKIHNSTLVTVFNPKRRTFTDINVDKYNSTLFYKTIDLNNESQRDFLFSTIASYENFLQFLQDKNATIDHSYLWDIVTMENPLLMRDGFNLIILEIPNNDATENIELLCPSNAYSGNIYDSDKGSVILIKQGEYYEPIYLYENKNGSLRIRKKFIENIVEFKSVKKIMKMIKNVQGKYCKPRNLQKNYDYKKNIYAVELKHLLENLDYSIIHQVSNYQAKTIGILCEKDGVRIFIPSAPSGYLQNISVVYMDNSTIWTDYSTTMQQLEKIAGLSNGRILCRPMMKILEDGLLVGILTETNQFIQFREPEQNIHIEDELPVLHGSNYIVADREITTKTVADMAREKRVKFIQLENQFYSTFRGKVRIVLNEYENVSMKQKILEVIENPRNIYKQKLAIIDDILQKMMANSIVFKEMKEEVLLSLDEILICPRNLPSEHTQPLPYCTVDFKNIFPKKNLIHQMDNERIYFGRMADELIRYSRIRVFMYNSHSYLNITNTDYKMNDNEFVILQSYLNADYFANLKIFNTNKYIQKIPFELASPNTVQQQRTEIPVTEQYHIINREKDETTVKIENCILEKRAIIGNLRNYWKNVFPATSREVVFKFSNNCNFYVIVSIMKDLLNVDISVAILKGSLIRFYKEWMVKYPNAVKRMFQRQGVNMQLVKQFVEGKMPVDDMFKHETYVLTDFDIWILATAYKLPIILFSTFSLSSLFDDVNMNWVTFHSNIAEKYYFVRSLAKRGNDNKNASFHLVEPRFYLRELGEFNNIATNSYVNKTQNVISLNDYLALLEKMMADIVV
jgi:hypothetical protein